MKFISNIKTFRPKQKTIRGKNNDSKGQITVKDIFIPLLTAVITLVGQQLFFEDNRRTEAVVGMQVELLKTEIPTLNRIMLFADSYILVGSSVIRIPQQIKETYVNDKLIKSDTTILESKSDTISYLLPQFIVDINIRKEFEEDFNIIKQSKGVMDYDVYLEIEKVIRFIEKNPLPNLQNEDLFHKSSWNKKATREEWHKLMNTLFEKADLRRHQY